MMIEGPLLFPLAVLATLAIASETCLTLSHLTFGGFAVKQSRFQRTRFGFGVLLGWDVLSFTFPIAFVLACGALDFENLEAWWVLWPTLIGFSVHAVYNVLYNLLHHQVYRKFHEVEHATLYDDGKFVLGKRILASLDGASHLYGAWLVFTLVAPIELNLAFFSLMLGAVWYVLYMYRIDDWFGDRVS
ncbi:MAG: hypothetical protein ACPG4T_06375 [Nannocystaceae bacterium]